MKTNKKKSNMINLLTLLQGRKYDLFRNTEGGSLSNGKFFSREKRKDFFLESSQLQEGEN